MTPQALTNFEPDYDADGDVLYVTWGDVETTHGHEVRPGVILRMTDANNIEGMTIYDVTRYFTFDPRGDVVKQSAALLATVFEQLSDHFVPSDR